MSVPHVVITAELAKAVGQIAEKHPDCALVIEWREGSDEAEWNITVNDGPSDVAEYIANDETGAWV